MASIMFEANLEQMEGSSLCVEDRPSLSAGSAGGQTPVQRHSHGALGPSTQLDRPETGSSTPGEFRRLGRQAESGETATWVLENLEPLLQEIHFSAALLTARLRDSRLQKLGKALGTLREHRTHLASFLLEGPGGSRLTARLESLADHLAAEQQDLLRELETLKHRLEQDKEMMAFRESSSRGF